MRRYLSVFLLFVGLFSCKEKQGDVVSSVNKKYTAINQKLGDYKQKRVDDITSTAKGTITGYYREEEVKKMYAEHFTDTNRVFTEYYFDDGMLIFIRQENFVYNRPNTYTEDSARAHNDSVWYDDKKTKEGISRFYFYKNKLVKWIGPDNNEIAPGTTAFIDKESILWAETVILIKELKETPTANP